MKVINEKTLIPIGLAISIIGGGAKWLTTMFERQEALISGMSEFKRELKEQMGEFRVRQVELGSKIQFVQIDVSEIKGEMKRFRRYSASADRMLQEILNARASGAAVAEPSISFGAVPAPLPFPTLYNSVGYRKDF